MPADNGMAFVVLTHLRPDRESLLAEILGRSYPMPVIHAETARRFEAEHVYVLPPGATLTIREGRLRLRRTGAADHERTPIDVFFNSLAEDQGEHAIGVVLSGGGSDGTLGLKAIKETWRADRRPGLERDRGRASPTCRRARSRRALSILCCRSKISPSGSRLCAQLGRFRPRNGRTRR